MRPLASALLALLLVAAPIARAEDGAPSVLREGEITVQPPKPAEPATDPAEDPELSQLRDDVDILCGGANARVQMNDSGASLPSYPCAVARTDLALYRLRAKDDFTATTNRAFLRSSIFMRGIGATMLGWLGFS